MRVRCARRVGGGRRFSERESVCVSGGGGWTGWRVRLESLGSICLSIVLFKT